MGANLLDLGKDLARELYTDADDYMIEFPDDSVQHKVLIVAGAAAGVEGGGLQSLQTMAIITAAPFTLVMIGIMISLVKAFIAEEKWRDEVERRILARELALEAQEMQIDPQVDLGGGRA